MEQIAKQIHQHLVNSSKILIVPHQNPDGDALGSLSALTEYMISLEQQVVLFCLTPVSKKYSFLRHVNNVEIDPNIFDDEEIDTIVILDSSDMRYAGVEKYAQNSSAKIINIDHHQTNEKYGHMNMVASGASSTAEVLYNFFIYNDIEINHHMATSLLTGIVTDTENFTNPATTTSSLNVAGELLSHGGNLNLITKWVVKNKTVNLLRLWGLVFSRLNTREEIVYTYITRDDLKKFGVSEAEAEGVANFLNNLEGAKISLMLRETEDGKIKASFRTTRDDVDVAALAKKFGGGGHRKAAGFSAEGTIEQVVDKVIKMK